MTAPVLFTFGLHLHQPVGNFDSVFEQHLQDVYAPLLDALSEGQAWPVSLHLSGPLLDWLTRHAPAYLDRLGREVAAGHIELLLAGYDEPILAVLPREDRIEQIVRLRDAIQRRFGVRATGLWLTERVWEPDLPEDLHRAGVEYVLVDDRHFLVTGFQRKALHRPYRTESGGHAITVLPIDERLRYLVPFRPAAELATYFRQLRDEGAPMAILADDGEKFGGWPGTLAWVYQSGWIRDFTETLRQLSSEGVIRMATFAEAVATVPSGGLAYLPTASYREMEGWALPAAASRQLSALETELGAERLEGVDGALVRGTHWRNFFVKYSESNRMHKKMLALSALARHRGDPAEARRAIGKAQCNDAYWHGVFGGLYLPHLREGIWRELAVAEMVLRRDEPLRWEKTDLDADGTREIWIHSAAVSVLLAPHRGGSIEEWTVFASQRNHVDVLTRRLEAYHQEAIDRAAAHDTRRAHQSGEGGAPSIHDLEEQLELASLPPFDDYPRALFQERLLGAVGSAEELAARVVEIRKDWGGQIGRLEAEPPDHTAPRLSFRIVFEGMAKRITVDEDGSLTVEFTWDGTDEVPWFATELSVAGPVEIESNATQEW
ncbi:MAG: alpha-amylase/4-alpha-glucanotransferase domain-containing protein, partial [Gemmatimonadales bacterium]